jgi:hypothetical protein
MAPVARAAEAFYNFITGFASFYGAGGVLAAWEKEYDSAVAVAQTDN